MMYSDFSIAVFLPRIKDSGYIPGLAFCEIKFLKGYKKARSDAKGRKIKAVFGGLLCLYTTDHIDGMDGAPVSS